MQLNPSEISELIKSRISELGVDSQLRNQGTVISVTDGICRVYGLSGVMQGEMLEFPGNTIGLALNLERDSVGAVVLGEYTHIKEGDPVKCTGRILEVPVGPELLGRVVDALGQPIDGKGPINAKESRLIEVKAPGDKIQRHQLARLLALQNAGFNARIEKLQWIVDPNRLYVVLDVETTGGKAGTDRVIEIGAVKVQGGEVLGTFSTLLNPGRYIPSFITRLTGINSAMVADAPSFADMAAKLAEFLQGAVFVAHNAKFDYGFIRAEFARLEQPFDMPQLCTVVNMRRYYPGLASYSLGKLCEEFDIKLTNHHRALADATATVELLKLINAKRCTAQ